MSCFQLHLYCLAILWLWLLWHPGVGGVKRLCCGSVNYCKELLPKRMITMQVWIIVIISGIWGEEEHVAATEELKWLHDAEHWVLHQFVLHCLLDASFNSEIVNLMLVSTTKWLTWKWLQHKYCWLDTRLKGSVTKKSMLFSILFWNLYFAWCGIVHFNVRGV